MGKGKTLQAFTHPQRVRLLYKTILKLHRGLPLELQALGIYLIQLHFFFHTVNRNDNRNGISYLLT